MLKNIILLPLLMAFLSSCTILSQEISGSQKIQIHRWVDHSPNILKNAGVDKLVLDINKENVLEFDVKVFGETVYVAYTTDKNIWTAKYPSTTSDILPDALKPGITATDVIREYTTIETTLKKTSSFARATIVVTDPPTIGDPDPDDITNNIPGFTQSEVTSQNKKGVWVRLFKGTLNENMGEQYIKWEPIIVTKEPIEIKKIAILPLNRQKATILASTDDSKVIVFNDADQNGVLNIIENDLLETSYKNIDQINTWVDGDKTYLSLVADNYIITGYYQNLIWFPTVESNYKFNISNMKVEMGLQNAYGVWINDTKKELIVAVYQESSDVSRRWLEIDNLTAIKNPTLNISTYKNSLGVHEDIYMGTVNQAQDFFQLFNIKDLKTFFTGPIISGWNERYAIAGNDLGQLLYVRSNFDHKLIFAGLNAFKQWDSIQIVRPPSVGIHPNSELKTFFLNNTYSLTVFKQENGSIYSLAGVR